jgi:hypothetical protein
MSTILTTLAKARAVLPKPSFRSSSSEGDSGRHSKVDLSLETKVDPTTLELPTSITVGKKGDDGQAKQEQIIQENLARFARIPAYSVFEFVLFSSSSSSLLTT